MILFCSKKYKFGRKDTTFFLYYQHFATKSAIFLTFVTYRLHLLYGIVFVQNRAFLLQISSFCIKFLHMSEKCCKFAPKFVFHKYTLI